MVLVTLIGNHLTFPIWKQVNLDQHTDYWPASLTRSIIGTLPQSWKGLKPPSPPPLVQLLEAADWKIGRTRLLWLHSSSIYNTIHHCNVQFGSKHTYQHKLYTLLLPFQLCLLGPFCLNHSTNIDVLPPWAIEGGWVGLWIKACYKIASIRQSRQQCAEGNTGTINTREQCRQIQKNGVDKYRRVVQTNTLLSSDRL